jgi:hypothetical protein
MQNRGNVENGLDVYGCMKPAGPVPTQLTVGDTRLADDSCGVNSSRFVGTPSAEQLFRSAAAPRVDGRRYERVVENASKAMSHSVSDQDMRIPPQPAVRSMNRTVVSSATDCDLSSVNAVATSATDVVSVKMMHRRSVPDLKALERTKSNLATTSGVRKKKTVTFNDNVKLVCIASDEPEPEPADCVNYPSGILKNSGPSWGNTDHQSVAYVSRSVSLMSSDADVGRDSDGASADDSEPELDETSPDGRPRCGLCRRKWADKGTTYCLDCRAYMSKLQPTAL